MMQTYDFYFGMNGGYFDYSQNQTYKPYGITIENSQIIREDASYFATNYTLTIDDEGSLGYANTMASGVTAQDVLEDGSVSALCGLVPLVVNGSASGVESTWWTSTDRSQRQIIGQYANGDYCVITCEGRNFDNSQGFTVTEAQNLCLSMGLEFAMAVDGGGSTETVIGDEQLNVIYEGATGRIVPTYIVFNGTDAFGIPSS
jgi:exopolysaccharide biosynthesis protein